MAKSKGGDTVTPLRIGPGLSINYIDCSLLKPYIGNARTHSARQISQLKASITQFGFTNPVLVDASLRVIAGHGRLLAAKELGLTSIPVIKLDTLTAPQVKALRIADNKIALNSGWDTDLLRIELAEIQKIDCDFELEVSGFSTAEIDTLLSPANVAIEDDVPAARVEPRSRLGDIWQLGDHRVGCGDSRDADFMRAVIGDDKSIDCAFMDPPWNVPIKGHANVSRRHREFTMASGEMSESAFRQFLLDALTCVADVSRDGAVHFICIDWRHLPDLSTVADEIYNEQLNLCVWNKSNAGMGSLYRSKHELIGVYRVGKLQHNNMVELGRHGEIAVT